MDDQSGGKEKILGWILLALGLLIIAGATIFVVAVLLGQISPPLVFNVEAPTINLPQASSGINLPEGLTIPEGVDLTELGQGSSQTTELKIIPDEVFSRLLNNGMVYLAMMFLATSGAKISGIGIQLIKEVKVNVKENRPKEILSP